MKITIGFLRKVLVNFSLSQVRQLEIQEIRKLSTDENFKQSQPIPLPKAYKFEEGCQLIENKLKALIEKCPVLQESNFAEELAQIMSQLKQPSPNALEILEIYYALLKLFEKAGLILVNTTESNMICVVPEKSYLSIEPHFEWLTLKNGFPPKDFIQAVCRLHEILRQEERFPTPDELLSIQVAKKLIKDGAKIEYPYCHWGTSGFRPIHTLMSITDPGEGHIYGTATKSQYLSGIITHIEHLERCNEDRLKIESYRIPNIFDVAIVRLFIGSDAPLSSYIGRPLFESGFQAGLLKTVNTLAGAVSQMFALGLTECKIAMEGMTSSQMIKFMQCMAGAVKRDKHCQILSAAFNINTSIWDDRHHPHWVRNRFQIGLLGIELTHAGGFEKVTWDGSSDSYPSKCVLEQLSYEEALELVHVAHEQGLLTYFSAGFRYHHLPLAVYVGVDGVGVGGAQILRYMDKQTGYHGPFKPENIAEILKIRDVAATHWLGQSAALLSRLDRMFYEGSLSKDDNSLRLKLFEAMKRKDEKAYQYLLERLQPIQQMPPDSEHPLIAWGKRLIAAGKNSLLAQTKTHQDWVIFIWTIQKAIETEDLDLLADSLEGAIQANQPSPFYEQTFTSQVA